MPLSESNFNINARNHAVWQKVATEYAGDAIGEDDPTVREFVRDQFSERLRGRRVLEIGCGPGTVAAQLAQRGLDVTATDFSPRFIDIAQHRFPKLDLRVMDMTDPNLPSGTFDGIYGFGSFIHLPRQIAIRTLPKLYELLTPDGILFLQLIKSTKGLKEYTIESWAGKTDCPMHFTCFEENEIEAHLTAAGYREIKFLPQPRSQVYDNLPRLNERGVVSYFMYAYR